jgi:hypothetical protein
MRYPLGWLACEINMDIDIEAGGTFAKIPGDLCLFSFSVAI